MVGDVHDPANVRVEDFRRLAVRREVRLEVAGRRDRDVMVEFIGMDTSVLQLR
jgi:hypothetical protein